MSDNGQTRYLYELLIDRRREDRTLTALEGLVDRLAGMREARTVALVMTDGWRLFNPDRSLADEAKEFGPSCRWLEHRAVRSRSATRARPPMNYAYMKDCNQELVRLAGLEDERRLRDLTVRANRANVSFYPVGRSGLAVFDTPISQSNRPNPEEDANRLRNRTNGMMTLAGSHRRDRHREYQRHRCRDETHR